MVLQENRRRSDVPFLVQTFWTPPGQFSSGTCFVFSCRVLRRSASSSCVGTARGRSRRRRGCRRRTSLGRLSLVVGSVVDSVVEAVVVKCARRSLSSSSLFVVLSATVVAPGQKAEEGRRGRRGQGKDESRKRLKHHCSCTVRQKSTFLLPRLNTMEPKRAKQTKK